MSETNNLKLKKHDNPETNEEQFDIENYLNVNWDKLEEFATNVDGKVIEIEDNIEEINKKDTEQDNKIVELQNEKIELEKELKEIQEDFYQSSIRGQASGEYIHVEDSSGARCKIGIGGNHKQDGESTLDDPSEIKTVGSNVNLFDITKYDYRNLAGANIQINNKTDFRVNATMNNNANCAIGFKIMDLTKYAGKILTVKSYVKSSTSTNKAFLVLRQNNSDYKGTKTNELFDESQNTTNGVITLKYKVTDTINDSNRYLFIWFYANRGTTCNIGDYIDYKVKLVAGTEIGEYSKYGQGAVKVTKCNKNIFDGKLELGRWSFSTGNAQEYANYVRSKNAILVKPNTIYTASCDVSGLTLSFTQFDENMNFINALPNQQATYKNCKYIKININDTTNVDLKVQLEEGSTATTYEPHQEQSYIMPTQAEMLEGDYFDFDNEEEVHVWGNVIVNETETINKNSNSEFFSITKSMSQFDTSATGIEKSISNYGTGTTLALGAGNTNNKYSFNASTIYLDCYNSNINTVEKLKAQLTKNNMKIYAKLATPTRLKFTDEQKAVAKELNNARTYKNVTNIYTTDEVSPAIELDYAKDLETLINNVQALALSNVSEGV